METTTEYKQSCLVNPDIPQTMPGTPSLPVKKILEISNFNIVDLNYFYRTNRAYYHYLLNDKCVVGFIKIKTIKLCFKLSEILDRYYPLEIWFINVDLNISSIDNHIKGKNLEYFADMEKIVFSNSTVSGLHELKNCKSIKFINMLIEYDHIISLNGLNLNSLCFENCRFLPLWDNSHVLLRLKVPTLNEFSINTELKENVKRCLTDNHPNMKFKL